MIRVAGELYLWCWWSATSCCPGTTRCGADGLSDDPLGGVLDEGIDAEPFDGEPYDDDEVGRSATEASGRRTLGSADLARTRRHSPGSS